MSSDLWCLNRFPAPPRAVLLLCLGLSALVPAAAAAVSRPVAAPPAAELAAAEGLVAGVDHALVTDDGRIQVVVELQDAPAAVVFAQAMQGARRTDKQALAAAGVATKAQVGRIQAAQSAVGRALAASPINAREIYRVAKVLNGISVAVDPRSIADILKIPGVKRVLPVLPEYPTSASSVPFIGTPNVWANTIGLPAGADGTGIRIGVIDTGVDYLHGDFGGTGLLADYMTESTASANFTTAGSFPTAKVVGGTDFAGDAYTGSNVPAPDPNPMDCNGHGSHVSGTAAGFGVATDGTTFAGPYDANTSTYTALRIEPGTAPKALLYGLRVFGCAGSTGLTVQGIDWAMDPNGDNDLSDHLDVINMSLGSSFGSVVNSSSVASDNAALAGVIVVTSAGNSGDTFFIAGSPGVATRAIATAASVDGGEFALSVAVNSPAAIAGSYFGGAAAFGTVPNGQTADAVIAVDDTMAACGADPNDGCCALTNAAAMAGKICVVNRGTCSFKTKALNCQNAGAIGTIVVNNAPGSPPPGMADDATIMVPITIPSEMVTLVDGATIKNAITSTPPVNVTLNGQPAGDTVASFSSRGPRRIYGSPLRLKPDISAPGLNITSAQTGHTCMTQTGCTGLADPSGFQAGSKTLIISGTSMASPHMAGIMALLREIHPDWSVEELKALAMNYATHDPTVFPNGTPPRYGLARIGAGRVDPAQSAVGSVIAMNAEETGLVSVTFEPEVVGTMSQTKKIRVVNKGTTSQTYTLGFDTVVDSPGVSFSLPGGNTVTVPAGETVELDVQMNANSALMDHTRDASLFPTQGVQANYGDQPRNFLTEEGAYLTFSQGATLRFRLPVYMAEKPSSMMSAPDTIVTGGAPTGSTTIPLSGIGLCSGTLAAGPTCTGTFPNDVESLVSPFELQVVSPLDPVNSTDYADIHYAGVAYYQAGGSPSITNDLVMFGLASWGNWSTLTDVAYNVCVDVDNDGIYDRSIINTDPSIFVANSQHNDNFVRVVQNLSTAGFSILGNGSYVNLVAPSVIDTGLHGNNVMVLAASPSTLGYTSTAVTTIKYKIVTCPGSNPSCARSTTGDHCTPAAGTFYDQAAGPYTYNWAAQGLNFGGDFLDEDLNGKSLAVTWNTANMTANGSLGALLLHHQNVSGQRAEVVLLDTAQRADLALTKTVDNLTPALGSNVVFTVTVTNNGPNDATGVVVNDFLPDGLAYVSDDGGGSYNPGTGLWAVGALANGASATLHITATVEVTDAVDNVASIAASSPLDPNPANDTATSALAAPRTADLRMTFGATPSSVNPGDPITYTLTVKNLGPDTAYSVDVQEGFPDFPALNPSSSNASQGVYDPATGHWDLASLEPGTTATLTFQVTAPDFAGSLVNDASTSAVLRGLANAVDPNPSDNSANAVVQVLSPATVGGTKSVSGSFSEGGTVTYTVVLSNTGAFTQQDNPGDEFTDTLPPSLTLVGASASAGTATTDVPSNTVHWSGSIASGGSVTITITAVINTGSAGATISNQGTVFFDADGDGTNESSAPTDDPATGAAGDPTSFVAASIAQVPTLSELGLAVLALLLASGALILMRRRRA